MPVETGPPLADPALVAARLLERSGADSPALVRFEWTYADRRGHIDGDGAARFNPPDSLRLDLFTSGEVAMAVALAGSRLTSLGQIEDVEVPPSAFLFAMGGLFRPGTPEPPAAFESRGDTVLVYGAGSSSTKLYFYTSGGRLSKVEERRNGRVRRKVELEWGADPDWPAEAEFRDLDAHSRVRWELGLAEPRATPHPTDLFELPDG